MPDWSRNFKAEYDYSRTFLGNELYFSEEWRPLIRNLYALMDTEGFNVGKAHALDQLRKQVTKGDKGILFSKKLTEDEGILKAVGSWKDDGSGTVDADARLSASVLKFLRHTYLLNRWGSRKIWLVSLPEEFQDWPSVEMITRGITQMDSRKLLKSSNEIFNAEQKKYLSASAQYALAWCQKAGIVLSHASQALDGKTKSKEISALNVVKRWFADPATTDAELKKYIGELSRGIKSIIAMLGRGQLVLTDWVPLRGASSSDDISWLYSEAFTFRSRYEGMDVVYIERSFFTDDAGGVLHGQSNWTRVLVHELSHLVCGTIDVDAGGGKRRYAHYGIGLHAGFTGSDASKNADSWAFFCADCANVLTEGERNHALRVR